MQQELSTLETQRDMLTNKGYMMLLEQIPVLAVPAFLAIFMGKKVAPLLNIPEKYVIGVLLVAALFASWKFILYRLMKFNSDLREVSNKIREIKSKNQIINSDSVEK